jgi:hypothetical protein
MAHSRTTHWPGLGPVNFLTHTGCLLAHSSLSVQNDWIVTLHSRANKITMHATSRTLAPIYFLSPVHVPTDGWMRHRRAASQRSPSACAPLRSWATLTTGKWWRSGEISSMHRHGLGSFPHGGVHLLPAWLPFEQWRPWRVSSTQCWAAARDLPTRCVDPYKAGGHGHGDQTQGESP